MEFSVSWSTLLRKLEYLPDEATLITPLSHDRFTVTNTQEQRVMVQFLDTDVDPNHGSNGSNSRRCNAVSPTLAGALSLIATNVSGLPTVIEFARISFAFELSVESSDRYY